MKTHYKQGTKVIAHGYEGAIVRHYEGEMYEIRLPGGVVCTEDFTLAPEENQSVSAAHTPGPWRKAHSDSGCVYVVADAGGDVASITSKLGA